MKTFKESMSEILECLYKIMLKFEFDPSSLL